MQVAPTTFAPAVGLAGQIRQPGRAGGVSPGQAARAAFRAGCDRTVPAIGPGTELLSETPGAWNKLHADPTRARGAFAETIRASGRPPAS